VDHVDHAIKPKANITNVAYVNASDSTATTDSKVVEILNIDAPHETRVVQTTAFSTIIYSRLNCFFSYKQQLTQGKTCCGEELGSEGGRKW
jgi:hypothetical protein